MILSRWNVQVIEYTRQIKFNLYSRMKTICMTHQYKVKSAEYDNLIKACGKVNTIPNELFGLKTVTLERQESVVTDVLWKKKDMKDIPFDKSVKLTALELPKGVTQALPLLQIIALAYKD